MSSYYFIFSAAAENELREALEWHADIDQRVRRRLVVAVDRTMVRIIENPHSYPVVAGSVRRAMVMPFRYGMLYRIEGNKIAVFSFFHSSRLPKRWQELH